MEIAAAAPKIGWSDLAYALAPTGRKLDYRANNPYGRRAGITKFSYLTGLYAAGLPGYYAPQGADPSADITTWKNELDGGPPYDRRLLGKILRELRRFRSSYSVQDHLPRSKRIPPAPTVIYSGLTDDIMPPDQSIHYYNRARKRFPGHEPSLIFEAKFAHNRGSLVAPAPLHDAARDALFARELMGERSAEPLEGVQVTTLACGGGVLGPFESRTWRGIHPGEVRVRGRKRQLTTSAGGNVVLQTGTDPFGGVQECPRFPASTDAAAATYLGKPAKGDGFTVVGSPTLNARVRVTGKFGQISTRLWDVAPDGSQTMVQHAIYKPRKRGRQTWQLHPVGYHFAAGHVPKLEILGRDFPYMQEPASDYEIRIRRLVLDLPVTQSPGGQIKPFAPPR